VVLLLVKEGAPHCALSSAAFPLRETSSPPSCKREGNELLLLAVTSELIRRDTL